MMNRSFRAAEEGMQRPSMRERQQQVMRGNGTRREKEEELAMFLEMRKRDKERNNLLSHGSEEFDAPIGSRPGNSPIFNIPSSAPTRRTGTDDFLNSENDKNDYDWLLTPPGTPLFPSLEMESQRTVMSQIGTPKARPTSLKSRLSNPQPELATRTHLTTRQTTSSPGLNNTSTIGLRRPSSSGGPNSRPSTPTGRPTLTSTSKSVSNIISKSTSSISSRSTPLTTSKSMPSISKTSSRSSTPTSRPTLPSTKPAVVPPRSSTPLSRTTPRSLTPTSRSTLPVSKPPSRSSTPTRRPDTCAPQLKRASSTVTKTGLTTSRNPVPTNSTNSCDSSGNLVPPRASSPTIKPRWNPSEMPGFSLDAPPNLRTSILDRPPSATRGRPATPGARSSSIDPSSNGRVRRQSCSPSRGRQPNGVKNNSYGSSVPAVSRIHVKANESVSPGLIGTKMVERVINMRRLVPPNHEDKISPRSNLLGKSSSPDSSGFGRSFSKKSLDMAVRHMDIRKNMQGNMRPLMSNIPASSMYSVRPGPTRSRTISVSDSPLATSSNASSEISVNNNGFCVDACELEDDINSERGARSPPNIHAR